MANAASDAVFAQLRLGAQFDGKRWKKHIDMFEEASAAAARQGERRCRGRRPVGSALHGPLGAPGAPPPRWLHSTQLPLAMHAGEELRRKAEEAAAAADAAWAAMDAEEDEQEPEGSQEEDSEHSGSEEEGSEGESGSEEEDEDAAGQHAKKRKLLHGAAAGGEDGEEQGTDDEGIELFKGQREQRGAAGLASPAAAFVDHEPQVGARVASGWPSLGCSLPAVEAGPQLVRAGLLASPTKQLLVPRAMSPSCLPLWPQVHTKDPFEEANVIRKAHRIKARGSLGRGRADAPCKGSHARAPNRIAAMQASHSSSAPPPMPVR